MSLLAPARHGLVAAAIALALAAITPCAGLAADAAPDGPTAPEFTLRTLDGVTLELAALLQHGPVLLDFWATWCKPCVQSLPEIDALGRDFGPRGLTVIGVSIDGPRNAARVRPFVSRLRLGYAIALDEDGALQQAYRVTAVPTAVLIDPAGRVAWRRQGYLPGEAARLREAVTALLPVPAVADSAGR